MKKLMVGFLCSVVVSGLLTARVIRYPFSEGKATVYAKKGDIIDIYDYSKKMDGKYHKVEYQREMLDQDRRLDEKSIKTFKVQQEGNHILKMTARKKHKKMGDRFLKKGDNKEVMKVKVQDH